MSIALNEWAKNLYPDWESLDIESWGHEEKNSFAYFTRVDMLLIEALKRDVVAALRPALSHIIAKKTVIMNLEESVMDHHDDYSEMRSKLSRISNLKNKLHGTDILKITVILDNFLKKEVPFSEHNVEDLAFNCKILDRVLSGDSIDTSELRSDKELYREPMIAPTICDGKSMVSGGDTSFNSILRLVEHLPYNLSEVMRSTLALTAVPRFVYVAKKGGELPWSQVYGHDRDNRTEISTVIFFKLNKKKDLLVRYGVNDHSVDRLFESRWKKFNKISAQRGMVGVKAQEVERIIKKVKDGLLGIDNDLLVGSESLLLVEKTFIRDLVEFGFKKISTKAKLNNDLLDDLECEDALIRKEFTKKYKPTVLQRIRRRIANMFRSTEIEPEEMEVVTTGQNNGLWQKSKRWWLRSVKKLNPDFKHNKLKPDEFKKRRNQLNAALDLLKMRPVWVESMFSYAESLRDNTYATYHRTAITPKHQVRAKGFITVQVSASKEQLVTLQKNIANILLNKSLSKRERFVWQMLLLSMQDQLDNWKSQSNQVVCFPLCDKRKNAATAKRILGRLEGDSLFEGMFSRYGISAGNPARVYINKFFDYLKSHDEAVEHSNSIGGHRNRFHKKVLENFLENELVQLSDIIGALSWEDLQVADRDYEIAKEKIRELKENGSGNHEIDSAQELLAGKKEILKSVDRQIKQCTNRLRRFLKNKGLDVKNGNVFWLASEYKKKIVVLSSKRGDKNVVTNLMSDGRYTHIFSSFIDYFIVSCRSRYRECSNDLDRNAVSEHLGYAQHFMSPLLRSMKNGDIKRIRQLVAREESENYEILFSKLFTVDLNKEFSEQAVVGDLFIEEFSVEIEKLYWQASSNSDASRALRWIYAVVANKDVEGQDDVADILLNIANINKFISAKKMKSYLSLAGAESTEGAVIISRELAQNWYGFHLLRGAGGGTFAKADLNLFDTYVKLVPIANKDDHDKVVEQGGKIDSYFSKLIMEVSKNEVSESDVQDNDYRAIQSEVKWLNDLYNKVLLGIKDSKGGFKSFNEAQKKQLCIALQKLLMVHENRETEESGLSSSSSDSESVKLVDKGNKIMSDWLSLLLEPNKGKKPSRLSTILNNHRDFFTYIKCCDTWRLEFISLLDQVISVDIKSLLLDDLKELDKIIYLLEELGYCYNEETSDLYNHIQEVYLRDLIEISNSSTALSDKEIQECIESLVSQNKLTNDWAQGPHERLGEYEKSFVTVYPSLHRFLLELHDYNVEDSNQYFVRVLSVLLENIFTTKGLSDDCVTWLNSCNYSAELNNSFDYWLTKSVLGVPDAHVESIVELLRESDVLLLSNPFKLIDVIPLNFSKIIKNFSNVCKLLPWDQQCLWRQRLSVKLWDNIDFTKSTFTSNKQHYKAILDLLTPYCPLEEDFLWEKLSSKLEVLSDADNLANFDIEAMYYLEQYYCLVTGVIDDQLVQSLRIKIVDVLLDRLSVDGEISAENIDIYVQYVKKLEGQRWVFDDTTNGAFAVKLNKILEKNDGRFLLAPVLSDILSAPNLSSLTDVATEKLLINVTKSATVNDGEVHVDVLSEEAFVLLQKLLLSTPYVNDLRSNLSKWFNKHALTEKNLVKYDFFLDFLNWIYLSFNDTDNKREFDFYSFAQLFESTDLPLYRKFGDLLVSTICHQHERLEQFYDKDLNILIMLGDLGKTFRHKMFSKLRYSDSSVKELVSYINRISRGEQQFNLELFEALYDLVKELNKGQNIFCTVNKQGLWQLAEDHNEMIPQYGLNEVFKYCVLYKTLKGTVEKTNILPVYEEGECVWSYLLDNFGSSGAQQEAVKQKGVTQEFIQGLSVKMDPELHYLIHHSLPTKIPRLHINSQLGRIKAMEVKLNENINPFEDFAQKEWWVIARAVYLKGALRLEDNIKSIIDDFVGEDLEVVKTKVKAFISGITATASTIYRDDEERLLAFDTVVAVFHNRLVQILSSKDQDKEISLESILNIIKELLECSILTLNINSDDKCNMESAADPVTQVDSINLEVKRQSIFNGLSNRKSYLNSLKSINYKNIYASYNDVLLLKVSQSSISNSLAALLGAEGDEQLLHLMDNPFVSSYILKTIGFSAEKTTKSSSSSEESMSDNDQIIIAKFFAGLIHYDFKYALQNIKALDSLDLKNNEVQNKLDLIIRNVKSKRDKLLVSIEKNIQYDEEKIAELKNLYALSLCLNKIKQTSESDDASEFITVRNMDTNSEDLSSDDGILDDNVAEGELKQFLSHLVQHFSYTPTRKRRKKSRHADIAYKKLTGLAAWLDYYAKTLKEGGSQTFHDVRTKSSSLPHTCSDWLPTDFNLLIERKFTAVNLDKVVTNSVSTKSVFDYYLNQFFFAESDYDKEQIIERLAYLFANIVKKNKMKVVEGYIRGIKSARGSGSKRNIYAGILSYFLSVISDDMVIEETALSKQIKRAYLKAKISVNGYSVVSEEWSCLPGKIETIVNGDVFIMNEGSQAVVMKGEAARCFARVCCGFDFDMVKECDDLSQLSFDYYKELETSGTTKTLYIINGKSASRDRLSVYLLETGSNVGDNGKRCVELLHEGGEQPDFVFIRPHVDVNLNLNKDYLNLLLADFSKQTLTGKNLQLLANSLFSYSLKQPIVQYGAAPNVTFFGDLVGLKKTNTFSEETILVFYDKSKGKIYFKKYVDEEMVHELDFTKNLSINDAETKEFIRLRLCTDFLVNLNGVSAAYKKRIFGESQACDEVYVQDYSSARMRMIADRMLLSDRDVQKKDNKISFNTYGLYYSKIIAALKGSNGFWQNELDRMLVGDRSDLLTLFKSVYKLALRLQYSEVRELVIPFGGFYKFHDSGVLCHILQDAMDELFLGGLNEKQKSSLKSSKCRYKENMLLLKPNLKYVWYNAHSEKYFEILNKKPERMVILYDDGKLNPQSFKVNLLYKEVKVDGKKQEILVGCQGVAYLKDSYSLMRELNYCVVNSRIEYNDVKSIEVDVKELKVNMDWRGFCSDQGMNSDRVMVVLLSEDKRHVTLQYSGSDDPIIGVDSLIILSVNKNKKEKRGKASQEETIAYVFNKEPGRDFTVEGAIIEEVLSQVGKAIKYNPRVLSTVSDGDCMFDALLQAGLNINLFDNKVNVSSLRKTIVKNLSNEYIRVSLADSDPLQYGVLDIMLSAASRNEGLWYESALLKAFNEVVGYDFDNIKKLLNFSDGYDVSELVEKYVELASELSDDEVSSTQAWDYIVRKYKEHMSVNRSAPKKQSWGGNIELQATADEFTKYVVYYDVNVIKWRFISPRVPLLPSIVPENCLFIHYDGRCHYQAVDLKDKTIFQDICKSENLRLQVDITRKKRRYFGLKQSLVSLLMSLPHGQSSPIVDFFENLPDEIENAFAISNMRTAVINELDVRFDDSVDEDELRLYHMALNQFIHILMPNRDWGEELDDASLIEDFKGFMSDLSNTVKQMKQKKENLFSDRLMVIADLINRERLGEGSDPVIDYLLSLNDDRLLRSFDDSEFLQAMNASVYGVEFSIFAVRERTVDNYNMTYVDLIVNKEELNQLVDIVLYTKQQHRLISDYSLTQLLMDNVVTSLSCLLEYAVNKEKKFEILTLFQSDSVDSNSLLSVVIERDLQSGDQGYLKLKEVKNAIIQLEEVFVGSESKEFVYELIIREIALHVTPLCESLRVAVDDLGISTIEELSSDPIVSVDSHDSTSIEEEEDVRERAPSP